MKRPIADYDAAIARNPDGANAYLNRGIAKRGLGQYEAAIADYDAAIARNPDGANAYLNRGIAKRGLGQYEAAHCGLRCSHCSKSRRC